MKFHLDRIGTLGTILGALAAAPACCLPLLAAVATSIGLSAFAPYQGALVHVLRASVVLTVVGAVIGFRAHRKWGPLLVAVMGATSVFYGFEIALSQIWVLAGLGGLVAAAIWNTIEGRRCAVGCRQQSTLQTQSIISCPHCGRQRVETMPLDSCLYFYECGGCKLLLRPKPGDCCVFCSYGSIRCPPKQVGTCAC